MLRTQPLADADLIISLFAENHGKIRGVARSGRRSRRRFGGTLEPLSRVRAAWVEKPGRDLHRIDSLEFVRSFATMQADPLLQASCAVLAELADAFCHEGQADHRGFRLLGAVLEALESGARPWPVIRYFEFWLLQLNGLAPEAVSCSGCQRGLVGEIAAVQRGVGVFCRSCDEVSPERGPRFGRREREFLNALRRRGPAELPDDRGVAAPGLGLEVLLRGKLESFAERGFRTYRHLRAMSGGVSEDERWR